MTYTPPANFPEFIERYPRHVRNLLARVFQLRGADLDDAVQDVYLHLLNIPEGSVNAHHPDRIAIYDESAPRLEAAFLGFVNAVVRNFALNQRKSASCRVAAQSISVVDLLHLNEDEDGREVTIEELQTLNYDSDLGLWFEAILNIAFEYDPLVAYAGVAVSVFRSKAEAASFLKISDARLTHCLRILKKIDSGAADAFDLKHRSRGAYRPRKKVTA